ncbi:non-ribosomal peptide synthetase, partial [Corallococcus sp. CA047B]|uniref:non-ribosomal peptide synthetase n=1 Tax=Corallococcus sp. CA047B TaxID=2316729 RepID=UPI0011C3808F
QALARELEVQTHTVALLPPGAVPKTSSGKIQRFACRAALVSGELAVLWRSEAAGAEPLVRTPVVPVSEAPTVEQAGAAETTVSVGTTASQPGALSAAPAPVGATANQSGVPSGVSAVDASASADATANQFGAIAGASVAADATASQPGALVGASAVDASASAGAAGNQSGASAPVAQVAASPARSVEELERILREELTAVLGAEAGLQGSDVPLTQLGMDSLAAADLQGRIEKRLGTRVSAATLLQDVTLQGLVASLAQGSTATGLAALPPVQRRPAPTGLTPASFSQQRLWFLQQLAPESTAYHVPVSLSLRGPLVPETLSRSLNELVRRHEALRTTFVARDGVLFQQVHAPSPVSLMVEEVASGESAPAASSLREALLDAWAVRDAQQPMDMFTGPLLRFVLLRFAPEDHVLLVFVHHLIADGWSVAVLSRELAALYGAFGDARPSPLPEPALQYGDFAAWQQAYLTPQALAPELAWWKQTLSGAPSLLSLATDKLRPQRLSSQGARRLRVLPAPLMAKLNALGRREGATPFMMLVSALAAVLHRWSGQTDFILGSATSGRDVPGTRSLVGDCTNFLPLRLRLPTDTTVSGLLANVKQTTLDALAHGYVPYDHVLAVAQPGSQRRELYNIAFVLDDYAIPRAQPVGGGLTLDVGLLDNRTTELDMTFEAAPGPDGLLIGCKYATDLFEPETIDRLLSHLENVVVGMVAAPETKLSELPVMTEAERHQVLHGWSPPVEPFATGTLVERFEAQVDRTPDAIAVSFEMRQLTYRELDARANRLAHVLQARGVGPEVLVGVCLERGVELVVSLLGILKAGGAYLPLDSAHPREHLAFLLEDARSPLVLSQASLEDRVPSVEGTSVLTFEAAMASEASSERPAHTFEAAMASGASSERPAHRNAPGDLAYVIYTSGSTGRPKGVMVQHDHVTRLFSATDAKFHFGPKDVWTLFHSYAFDFSVWELWGALLYGGRLVVVPYFVSRSPQAFLRLLADEGVTVLNQTPTAFRQLLHAEQQAAAQNEAPALALRYVIFGGEALDLASLRPWFERHGDARPQLVNMYGITETTVHVTWRPVGLADLERPGSSVIGQPIADLQLYLLDAAGQPVPLGVPGEIHVGGAGVARGYLRRPELTAARFVDDRFGPVPDRKLYRAGDLARRLPSGDLEYLGRIDHQVKLRGFRIELGEIESSLSTHPDVRETVVIVREDVPGDQRLVAYVVPATVEAGVLREHLRARLPEYMVPAAFVGLDALPLTTNGKVDRRELPAPSAATSSHEDDAPLTPLQEQLASLFREVLRVERVGAHDDFFDLGGHSLLATQLVTRVAARFGVDLPLRTLFEAPTLTQLAERIQALPSRAVSPSLPTVPRDEDLPLSFAQQRMWFLEQLEPGQALYNIPLALRLTGALDVEVLRRTFAEIVRRHEPLRTTFLEREGQPLQRIHAAPAEWPILPEGAAPAGWPLPIEVLPEGAAREDTLRRRMRDEAALPFDLRTGPLLRTRLLRLAAQEHVLLLTLHHIVSDGWSMGVLVHEVGSLYAAFAEGRPSPLPALSVQAADFAVWQRQTGNSEGVQAHLEALRDSLKDLPALTLPSEHGLPTTRTLRGASHVFTLPATLVRTLEQVARERDATLFMVLLAGYEALLSRYSGQDDFAVGSPVAHRTRPELEPLIGVFLNTLVLRARLDGNPRFTELLDRVRESSLAAYAHQDVPFERLVEALQTTRGPSRTPLFQVMFALHNAPVPPPALPGVRVELLPTAPDTSRFDVSLSMMARDEGLEGTLEYSLDLFTPTTAARLASQFRVLLEAVAKDVTVPVSRLPLMDAEERSWVLVDWNAAATLPFTEDTLPGLFEAHVRRAPDAVAVEHEGKSLTYGALDARANQLARHLVSLGLRPEGRVGLCLERGLDLVVGMLGVLKAGGCYVPLDPSYPQQRLTFMFQDAGLSAVVTERALLPSLLEQSWPTVYLDSLERHDATTAPVGVPVLPGQLAYVLYTSGSTGTPKGAGVEHRSIVHLVRETNYVRLTPQDCIAQVSTPSFDAATFEIWGALLNGARLVILPRDVTLSPPHLARKLREVGATTVLLTTALFHEMAREEPGALAALRNTFFGGDRADPRA